MWDAYRAQDERAHSEILADDFRAVHPDGSVHIGKPTAREIAATPIEDYWLREIQAWPVGAQKAVGRSRTKDSMTPKTGTTSDISAIITPIAC